MEENAIEEHEMRCERHKKNAVIIKMDVLYSKLVTSIPFHSIHADELFIIIFMTLLHLLLAIKTTKVDLNTNKKVIEKTRRP